MATISDAGSSVNDWSNAQTWSGGVIPDAADSVVVKYQVDVTTVEAANSLTIGNLVFSATGQLTVNSLTVGASGGTRINIQMNGGALTAGSATFSSPLIEIDYGTFDVQSAAPASWSGNLFVGPVNGLPVSAGQMALFEFNSGGIQTIEAGSGIAINGATNYLADASSLQTNSALSSLSSNLGSLSLYNGAHLTLTGDLTNQGHITVDNSLFVGDIGGSVLTIAGTLDNTNAQLTIGSFGNNVYTSGAVIVGILTADTPSIAAFTGAYTGSTIDIENGYLLVQSAAPSVWNGMLEFATLAGSLVLTPTEASEIPSILEFASGSITSTSVGSTIELVGPNPHLITAQNPDSNSALAGLSILNGELRLDGGATVTTATALTANATVWIEEGSTFIVGGDFTNTYTGTATLPGTAVGAGGESGGAAMTVNNLKNSGLITVGGNSFLSSFVVPEQLDTFKVNGSAENIGSGGLTNKGLFIVMANGYADITGNASSSGTGEFVIQGGELEIGGTVSGTIALYASQAPFNVNSGSTYSSPTLKLDDPSAFNGTLSILGLTGTIDLLNTNAASVSFTGNSLVVSLQSGSTLTYNAAVVTSDSSVGTIYSGTLGTPIFQVVHQGSDSLIKWAAPGAINVSAQAPTQIANSGGTTTVQFEVTLTSAAATATTFNWMAGVALPNTTGFNGSGIIAAGETSTTIDLTLPAGALANAGDEQNIVFTAGGSGTPVISGSANTVMHNMTATATIAELAGRGSTDVNYVAVADSTANIGANLDTLQKDLGGQTKGTYLLSVTLTDTQLATLSVTPLQLSSDSGVLSLIQGNFDVSVDASAAANQTIDGIPNHATTAVFSGKASEYKVTATGGGNHLTVTDTLSGGSGTDELNNMTALQFADQTVIVATTPGPANAVTTGNVTELYSAVLAREPDVGGLVFYQNYLKSNPTTSLQTFAEFFLNSTEYTSKHTYAQSAAGDTQFIQDSYQNLLNRTPSASEVSFYENNVLAPAVAGLTAGTSAYASAQLQAHAQMLVYFSASAEFLGDVQITASTPASASHWLLLT